MEKACVSSFFAYLPRFCTTKRSELLNEARIEEQRVESEVQR